MSNFSQQDLYSITLNESFSDTITITSGSGGSFDTMAGDLTYIQNVGDITIDLGHGISYNASDTITTVNNIYSEQYEIDFGGNWRTHFPDFLEVEAMCKEYPALEKALENFKTIYEMVKDDYASKIKNSDT